MFTIGIDHFFILYISIIIGIFVIYWVRQLRHESINEWNISQEQLCNCKNCNLTFISKRIEAIAKCPSCDEEFRIKLKKSHKSIRY